jgi:tRNA 2-thiocytidine biosynthesis protein TtcA
MINPDEKKKDLVFKKLSAKAGKTIYDNKLISPGDRVLIGLSGGKDSLALLEILKNRQDIAPFDFHIIAAHIHVSDAGYSADDQYLADFCKDLNIEYIHEEIEAGLSTPSKKAACFVCSWHRRKKLFDLTKSLNCNKLTLGHHRDDALETLLINMMYHGSISSLPYKLRMFNGRVHLIRPLLDIWENEISEFSTLRNYSPLKKDCKYESKTKRALAKNLLNEIQNIHPEAKINIFRAMDNFFPEYLPGKNFLPNN